MRSKTVSRDEVASLYKLASSGMTKKALELNDDAKAALIGALGGAGVGLVSHMVTPKDKDEDQTSRLLSHVLAGAAMGGLSGYGLKRLHSRVADATKKDDPGWYQRNAPELSYSRAATLGGLGAGAYAGLEGANAIRSGIGMAKLENLSPSAARGIRLLRSSSPSEVNANPLLQAVQDAVGTANTVSNSASLKAKILRKLPGWLPKRLGGDAVRRAISDQAAIDKNVLDALRAAGGRAPGSVSPNEARILASRIANPRGVLNALRRGGKGKRALYAALASILLLGGGEAIRSQNRN